MAQENEVEVAEEPNGEPKKKHFGWYVWWKIDRTLAILGILAIVYLVMHASEATKDALMVGSAGISALSTYIGARSAK